MCGIFGRITPRKPVDLRACYAATQTLAHRGPDGLGVAAGRLGRATPRLLLNPVPDEIDHQSPPASDLFLGHRRLSIIDLTPQAFQPMANEDGSVWVVFNGEIYNHAALRPRLEACGHRFATDHSDTEVLVHGYERWGAGVLDHLRGMFALAILDAANRRLLLARDRFGEKPLYYALDEAGVTFASELKALCRLPGTDRDVCPEALVDYLHRGVIPAPRTIYRAVNKLAAAECLLIDLDDPLAARPELYWSLRYEPDEGKSAEEWHQAFDAELCEAVRLRTISDVPLGTFLSGGLDSTMVLGQMSRLSNLPVNTFSIGFSESRYDETAYAERAAAQYGARHRRRTLTPDVLLDQIPTVAEIFDEPFADSSAIPTFLVCKLAREDVTVALSGDGGDEMLAGYSRYALHHRLARLLDPLPGPLVRTLLGPVARLWPEHWRGKGLVRLLVPGADRRYEKVFRDEHLLAGVFPDLRDRVGAVTSLPWPDRAPTLVDRLCTVDRRFYIPDDLMVKVDRTSMRVSLEARAPLLDHKLFELVARMPLSTRFDGRRGKLPFRRILSRELGDDFVRRPKKGFGVPLGRWFRGELHEELRQALLDSAGMVRSMSSRPRIEKLIDDHCRGRRDQSMRLWRLYMLEKWHVCYGRGVASSAPARSEAA